MTLTAIFRRIALTAAGPVAGHLYRWDDIDVAFIVSTGRTGTEFLANLLGQAFDRVDARHEPSPDLFDLAVAYARGELSSDRAESVLRRNRTAICRQVHRNRCDVYVESNNNLAYLIPVLRGCFPKYKLVHVVRDGRDVVRSWYSKTVRPPGGDGREVLFLSEQDHRRRLQAIDLQDDPYRDRWAAMTRFERLCWLWAKKDSIIQDAIAGDERAMSIHFEDIFDSTRGYPGLWKIIDFLGLRARMRVSRDELAERMTMRMNRTGHHRLPHWREWSPEQMRQFVAIAGDHMVRCGYAL